LPKEHTFKLYAAFPRKVMFALLTQGIFQKESFQTTIHILWFLDIKHKPTRALLLNNRRYMG